MEASSFSFLSQDIDGHNKFNLEKDEANCDDEGTKRRIIGIEHSSTPFTDILDPLFFLDKQEKDVQSPKSDEATILDNNASENLSDSAGSYTQPWVKSPSTAWWDKFNNPDLPDQEYRQAFRMGKSTFDFICNELESTITRRDTMLCQVIPVRQRVAICLWRLATGEPLQLVSKRFGICISNCHKLVMEVCFAIKTILMPNFIIWPDEHRVKQINDEFDFFSGIPNVGGSMYTTHIPIRAPSENHSEIYLRKIDSNNKASYSSTIQGVVDPNGVFTDLCIGWPGSMSDENIFERSKMYQHINWGLSPTSKSWIVGGSNYPLTESVLVPYSNENPTWMQHSFNQKMAAVEGVAKEAFARLKTRWACLQRETEVKPVDLPTILATCCVLHNICEMRGDTIDPESKFKLVDDKMTPENAPTSAVLIQARDQLASKVLYQNQNIRYI
ncbi:protein ALP1-like [Impatiens glandulifera]|uniref:protein ALP1-like n=1 Tax=Impatiens glandulifera TaxID=253017 RepID=UPI001FB0BD3E|nr:protein ALP1-like [Impatiens glandulifera]